jgi:hypothetical protein
MRSYALAAALAGTALAAPFTQLGAINKRQSGPQNKFTVVKAGTIDDVIVNDDTVLNGTYTGDKTKIIKPHQIREPVSGNLPLKLVNNLGGENLKCYIAGTDSDGKVVFLGSDASLIYPTSGGSAEPVPIADPIAITMPAQGETFEITIPIAFSSGRVYFSEGDLAFYMVATGNGGEGLVQPSINNAADPSVDLNWGFVELTLTEDGVVWANISYVDFVGIIMSMTLNEKDGKVQEVVGLAADGVQAVCDGLLAQGDADGRPWGAMCLTNKEGGAPLRVVSPEDYEAIAGGGFEDYWTSYVDEVWELYKTKPLTINTQNDGGEVQCKVEGDELKCDGDNRGYVKPVAMDIWGCNTGPFGILEGDNGIHLAVVPRLCAAFTRHTLTDEGGDYQPGPGAETYYQADPTSHYSKVIKGLEVDGKGYTFAYDDVNPDSAPDAAGLVSSGNFNDLTFYIGGKGN